MSQMSIWCHTSMCNCYMVKLDDYPVFYLRVPWFPSILYHNDRQHEFFVIDNYSPEGLNEIWRFRDIVKKVAGSKNVYIVSESWLIDSQDISRSQRVMCLAWRLPVMSLNRLWYFLWTSNRILFMWTFVIDHYLSAQEPYYELVKLKMRDRHWQSFWFCTTIPSKW
jgi:hypothetical protein